MDTWDRFLIWVIEVVVLCILAVVLMIAEQGCAYQDGINVLTFTADEIQISGEFKHYLDAGKEVAYYLVSGYFATLDMELMQSIYTVWYSGKPEIEVEHPLLKHSCECCLRKIEYTNFGKLTVYFEGKVDRQEFTIPEAIDYPEREK